MRTPLCTFEQGDEKDGVKFHLNLIRNDIQKRAVVWYQFAFKTLDGLDTDENVLVAGLG